MHTSRTVIRVPHVCRLTRALPSTARSMSFFPAPLLPRLGGFPSHDFAPLFRMLDDYTSQAQRAMDFFPTTARAPQVFQPRFDVREVEGAYELRGELPGVEQRQLEVEFTDAQTLVVRGRTERESSSGSPPAAIAAAPEQVENVNTSDDAAATETSTEQVNTTATEPAIDSDAMSTHSSASYQKATVEDEDAASTTTPGQATPAGSSVAAEEPQQTSQVNTVATPAPQQTQQAPQQQQQQQPRYWVSERSVGEFQRTFTFPSRINHDNVRASLKDGVLHIVVPKAVAPASRRINVE